MIIKTKLILFVTLGITILINVPWRHFTLPWSLRELKQATSQNSSDNIVIGIMTCAGGYPYVYRGRNESKSINKVIETPLTLIKSVLISAKIWKVRYLEFHIFTDGWVLTQTLQNEIDHFKIIMKDYVELNVHYYNAFEAVPSGRERDFIDAQKRCGYVRIFFPTFLPESLKGILYLDSDIIVTGNIMQIWRVFRDSVVEENGTDPVKLASMVQNSEIDGKNYLTVFNYHFRDVPHVPPRGVNSGVMFMNLEEMRRFNWTGTVLKIVEERRDKLIGDQQLINIFFHDYLDRLVQLPCQYNFQHLHCEMGLSCKSVMTDPSGIQIMHGAGGMFMIEGRSHFKLFQAFKWFNLEHHKDVVLRLFKPLIKYYSDVRDIYKLTTTTTTKSPKKFGSWYGKKYGERATCQGKIGKYLFRGMLD